MGRKRGKIYGVGINDADYVVFRKVNGEVVWRCPYYVIWANMYARCYSKNSQKKSPTYRDCTVAEHWHLFTNFLKWAEPLYREGLELDKDILVAGNKIYGPDTCLFVSPAVNRLLIDSGGNRGQYPIGVSFCKRDNKFQAHVRVKGDKKFLGHYTSAHEAHVAFLVAKGNIVAVESLFQEDDKLSKALLKISRLIISGDYYNTALGNHQPT